MKEFVSEGKRMKGRDLLKLSDFSREEIESILHLAAELKAKQKRGEPHRHLEGKSLIMVFEKPSARTRISFEVGMFQLGGQALNVNATEVGIGQRESIQDVARTVSRYADGVMIRAYYHWMIEEFAGAASVPVINGLSDHYHPCQALADILTVQERFGDVRGARICYVGDGNNVCNSLIEICSIVGVELVISCPSGYDPLLKKETPFVSFERDPLKAARGANVVYTDVWVSMGQEQLSGVKLNEFMGYAVTEKMMANAAPGAIFMHCLPAHPGLEVEEEVLEGKCSVVFDQAENRLHAQKAVLALLL
jgi:ornithine carbamoyltransferase